MKPGFLTDSSPVEFLNQVDNNRDQEKRIEEKISCLVFKYLKLHIFLRIGKIMVLALV